MPTWARTKLTMRDIANKDVFSFNEEGSKCFDFNKLIPMPEELDIPDDSDIEPAVITLLTKGLTVPFEEIDGDTKRELKAYGLYDESKYDRAKQLKESGREYMQYAERYLENLRNYGTATWYGWATRNWGTKWNACDTTILSDDEIAFNTAWCTPVPVLDALSKKYPKDALSCIWATEYIGDYAGELRGKGGITYAVEYEGEDSMAIAEDVWNY